jgi:hypothetical protein
MHTHTPHARTHSFTWCLGNEISLALANGGFQLSPQGINSVLSRFDPNRSGLTLEAYTEVALFLASLR